MQNPVLRKLRKNVIMMKMLTDITGKDLIAREFNAHEKTHENTFNL